MGARVEDILRIVASARRELHHVAELSAWPLLNPFNTCARICLSEVTYLVAVELQLSGSRDASRSSLAD